MKKVIEFLEKNGFERMEEDSYANDWCNVVFESNGKRRWYAVADNEGNAIYSKDINIYWLVGVLTWYGYIDKNYKQ